MVFCVRIFQNKACVFHRQKPIWNCRSCFLIFWGFALVLGLSFGLNLDKILDKTWKCLFFFSPGHGVVHPSASITELVAQDGQRKLRVGSWPSQKLSCLCDHFWLWSQWKCGCTGEKLCKNNSAEEIGSQIIFYK